AGPRPGGRARALARESPGGIRAPEERGSLDPRGLRGPRRHAPRRKDARPSRLCRASFCAAGPGRPQLGSLMLAPDLKRRVLAATASEPSLTRRQRLIRSTVRMASALAVPLLLFLLVGGPRVGAPPARRGCTAPRRAF